MSDTPFDARKAARRRMRRTGEKYTTALRFVRRSVAAHSLLAALFDVAANGGLEPEEVLAEDDARLWWRCPVGEDHLWSESGTELLGGGLGCPFCAGRRVSVTNSLGNFPELAAQFDMEANGGLAPDEVLAASTNRRLWWRCPVADDHRWQAVSSSRLNGHGCPACAGRQASVTNTLLNYPELAAQFDMEANGGRTPEQIIAGTVEKLWWVCPVAPDHRWQATGANRLRGTGCPACAGRLVSVSNNLARFPVLAAEFDVAANGGLTAEQVVAGTHRRLSWRCRAAGHRWQASGATRMSRGGCPVCWPDRQLGGRGGAAETP